MEVLSIEVDPGLDLFGISVHLHLQHDGLFLVESEVVLVISWGDLAEDTYRRGEFDLVYIVDLVVWFSFRFKDHRAGGHIRARWQVFLRFGLGGTFIKLLLRLLSYRHAWELIAAGIVALSFCGKRCSEAS